jgi:hypothetical protein
VGDSLLFREVERTYVEEGEGGRYDDVRVCGQGYDKNSSLRSS